MVSLMTALWFAFLEAPDRVSVKPHASPVLHAINYLLGRLEPRYLETLRQFGGLQSYPSRAKDPDPVDYSTGSVGIGATAPIWGALAHRYVAGHFDVPVGGRQIALIGDAELDEGACWEAIADPMVARLGEVHVGRRPQPPVARPRRAGHRRGPARRRCSRPPGWHCVMVKYGPRLRRRTRRCARASTRCPTRSTSGCCAPTRASCASGSRSIAGDLEDDELLHTFRDLGGHDLGALLDGYRQADAVRDRPSVVFAYTIKGWRLPTEGHPANHSALLNGEQYARAGGGAGRRPGGPVGARSTAGSAGGRAVREPRRGGWRGRRAAPAAAPPRGARRPRPRAQGHRPPPSRRSGASSSTSRARRRRWPSASSPSRPTSAPRPTSAAGSTRPGSGRSATGSTGSPTTPTRSCAGARPTTAATSSSGSPRSTSSGCSASSARRGRATASRCCRSARSTTRSSRARSSRGRSASTRAASRSSSARRAASRSGPRAARTSR